MSTSDALPTQSTSGPEGEQFVAFRLAGEMYGFPILQVQEIVRPFEITRVPNAPPDVRGVVNLRGNIVPVVDLRTRLRLPSEVETGETRTIIVETEAGTVGALVDSVSRVVRIPASQIEPPSEMIAGPEATHLLGMGKLGNDLIILLDARQALASRN